MKKIALFALAMGFSFAVNAAPTAIGGQVTQVQCPLLAESVNLSLSTGVVGAYNCIEGVAKEIKIATCSTAGRTTPRTTNGPCNAQGLVAGDAGFVDDGRATCDANGVGPVVNFRGSYIYAASSNGGKVTPSNSNDSLCATGTVNTAVQ